MGELPHRDGLSEWRRVRELHGHGVGVRGRRDGGLFGADIGVLAACPPGRRGRRQKQRNRGVIGTAVRGRAPGCPGRQLAGQPVHFPVPEHPGEVLAERTWPPLDHLRVAVAVGGEQHGDELVVRRVDRGDPEVGTRIGPAQAGRDQAVELRVGRDWFDGLAVTADAHNVAISDLRQDQPAVQDHGKQQSGAIGDGGVITGMPVRLLGLGKRVAFDIGEHCLPPPAHNGRHQELLGQLRDLFGRCCGSSCRVRLSEYSIRRLKTVGEFLCDPAADLDGEFGAASAA